MFLGVTTRSRFVPPSKMDSPTVHTTEFFLFFPTFFSVELTVLGTSRSYQTTQTRVSVSISARARAALKKCGHHEWSAITGLSAPLREVPFLLESS